MHVATAQRDQNGCQSISTPAASASFPKRETEGQEYVLAYSIQNSIFFNGSSGKC